MTRLNRRWACVRIPKFGDVKFRLTRPLGGRIKNASIRTDSSGRWYVGFGLHIGRTATPPNGHPPVGVDFGVKQTAYLSDETESRLMPQALTEGEKQRLTGLERRKERQIAQAKKHRGGGYGNRLRRTLRAIAELKARQARRRLDFIHMLTTDLAKNHGLVAIEDLRVKQMTRSATGTRAAPGVHVSQKAALNRAILDNLPGERRRQLVYRCPAYDPTSLWCTLRGPRRHAVSATFGALRRASAATGSSVPGAGTPTTRITMPRSSFSVVSFVVRRAPPVPQDIAVNGTHPQAMPGLRCPAPVPGARVNP